MSRLITIYQKDTGYVRAVVDPDDKSQQQVGIMRGDIVTLTFSVAGAIPFGVGDYCTIFGNNYKINSPVGFKKSGTRNYNYTVTLEADQYDLTKCAYLFLDASNHFTDGQFTILGKPIDFMRLVIYNLNRLYPGAGWSLGVVDDAPYQSISFQSQNCSQALSTLASTFLTEYIFEGHKISLTVKQPPSGLTLEYGKGKALYSLARQNQSTSGTVNMFTRLYAYGSNKNIGANYRGGAKYLRMAAGLYIEKNVAQLGVFENTVFFDGKQLTPEIYPQRTGFVTGVTSDFIFTDADIDFNVTDYLILGVTAQVTFNSGQLGGYTFDIASWNNITKTFTINSNTSDQTLIIPSDLLKPAIGDAYVITNITMPPSYVADAEAQLLLAAQAYLNSYGPAKLTFTVEANPFYFKENNIIPALGCTYTLLSAEMNINREIRLVNYTRNLRNPFLYTIDLADKVIPQPLIIKLINGL
jgi:hypothetical protein